MNELRLLGKEFFLIFFKYLHQNVSATTYRRSMSYALEHLDESERLEKQALISAYSLEEELSKIDFSKYSHVLDAGCGGGMLSRYIVGLNSDLEVDAFDGSETRISQAKKASLDYPQINYGVSSLDSINVPSNKYDLIICRYVFEYLTNPLTVLQEFKRLLKSNGKLVVIDFDGILLNYHTKDNKLNGLLDRLRRELHIDLFVGRKIQHYLDAIGFKKIKYDLSAHSFSGEDMNQEIENNKMRFNVMGAQLEEILGKEDAAYFMNAYIREMSSTSSTLFANKFVYSGTKMED